MENERSGHLFSKLKVIIINRKNMRNRGKKRFVLYAEVYNKTLLFHWGIRSGKVTETRILRK